VYPWAGLNGLDRKLIEYLPSHPGFFIEAGANDGIRQSNTLVLERKFGWSGLLVEPIPRLADQCRRNRRKSIVKNVALVGAAESGQKIRIDDVDLMTSMAEASEDREEFLQRAEDVQGISRRSVEVECRTLSEILDEIGSPHIDVFSLDVEGFELQVLSGLDLSRHCPRILLVETKLESELEEFLAGRMRLVAKLTHHDYLFVRID
jgi:FkbM family methyltransferase